VRPAGNGLAVGTHIEELAWTNLKFNGQPILLSADSSRQRLSLDPAVTPSLPDLSKVNPMLIGPITDLFTFYADLWLAIKTGALQHAGDHQYVKNGSPNSWADGAHTILGQDSIDFDLTLANVDSVSGQATVLVRHLPPAQPQIKLPADWMRTPVADTPNNWVEVAKEDSGEFLAEVGKETFDVELILSTADGKIVAATMDNPVSVLARLCDDAALSRCDEPQRYQIRRQIAVRLQ
jgi:hypothetical protein